MVVASLLLRFLENSRSGGVTRRTITLNFLTF